MGEAFLHGNGGNGLQYKSLSASLPAPYNVFYNGQAVDISHAAITANLGKVTVSVSPGSCTFSPQTATTSTTAITVSFTIGGVTKTASIPITVLATSSFANTPWEIVAQAAYYGFPKYIWQPGDTKTLTIGSTTHTIRIIGFDCDPLDENDAMYNDPFYNGGSKKSALSLQWATPAGVVSSSSEVGGGSNFWWNCNLRTVILPALLESMPNALKNNVRTVDKVSYTLVSINGSQKKSVSNFYYGAETIFLLSYFDSCYMNPSALSDGSFNDVLRFDKNYSLFEHEWGGADDYGGYVFGDYSSLEKAHLGEMTRITYTTNTYNYTSCWRMAPESVITSQYPKYINANNAYFPVFNL